MNIGLMDKSKQVCLYLYVCVCVGMCVCAYACNVYMSVICICTLYIVNEYVS